MIKVVFYSDGWREAQHKVPARRRRCVIKVLPNDSYTSKIVTD